MTNPLITPEDLLYITDFENDSNFVRISVDTNKERVEIYSIPLVTEEWANNRGKTTQYDLDGNSYEISVEEYMTNFFTDEACLDLARFAVQYYPETIKSII